MKRRPREPSPRMREGIVPRHDQGGLPPRVQPRRYPAPTVSASRSERPRRISNCRHHSGKQSLQSLTAQGRDILLIFSSPFCEPCRELSPNLIRWARELEAPPHVLVVSRGGAQENLAKMKDFEASRVLLQRNFKVAEAYDCSSTPSAVLVGRMAGSEAFSPQEGRRSNN